MFPDTQSVSDPLPFHGYRTIVGATVSEEAPLVSTLDHFYQAERFRGNSVVFRSTLDKITAKEARKFAAANKALQRPDWIDVFGRVMRAGLWMQLVEYPWLTEIIRAGRYNYPLKDREWNPKGKSSRFSKLLAFVHERLDRPTRVFIVGSGKLANPLLVEAFLTKAFRRQLPDEIVLRGRLAGCDPLAELWAIKNFVPVRRVTSQFSRMAHDVVLQQALSLATHVVVFASPDEMRYLRVCQQAETLGKAVRLCRIPPSARLDGPGKLLQGPGVHLSSISSPL